MTVDNINILKEKINGLQSASGKNRTDFSTNPIKLIFCKRND